MIIYKDRFTGDEMFSDAMAVKVVNGVFYEFDSKQISENTDMSQINIGANASAEEAAEEFEDAESKDFDIVINHKCKKEESKLTKKEFKAYMKRHLPKILEFVKKDLTEEQQTEYKKKAEEGMKKIFKAYDDYDFYTSEHADLNDDSSECAILYLNYREDGITPYFTGLKEDFIEEKV